MGDAELVPARFGQKRFKTQLFRPLVIIQYLEILP